MKKPALLLNLLWAAVAAGSFYAGVVWRGDRTAETAASRGARFPTAPEPVRPAGGDQSGMIKAGTVSRDDDVLDFFKRYGLDSGTPLSAETMTQAVTEALRETNPIKSQMLFARLMEELTPENAPAALAMLRENASGFESMRYMGMLAYAWGGVDPKAAMEVLQTDGNNRDSRMGVGSVLTGWAAEDPQGAMAWLEKFEGEGKEWLSQSLITGLAKSDFDGAMKYATALEDEGEKRRASETLARELIRSGGVDKAKEWLASLSDGDMKSSAFGTVAEQLRRSDPEKAAEFIRENAAQPFARDAVAGLVEDMSRKDVQQALTYVNSLTGPNQARAYAEVIGEWMDRNEGAESVQASQYVTQMPVGESRDAASEAIARRMSGEDPAAAIAWAGAISNPEQREDALVDVGRRYLRMDPVNGATWLAQSGLSAEAQQEITAPREERGGGRGWQGGAGGPPAGGRGGFGGPGGGGGFGGGGGRRGGR